MTTHSHADAKELNKFSELAARWWDREGPCAPLHDINPIRLQFIENQLDLNQAKVIDVGCGGGILSESMASQGAEVIGIDAGQDVIEVAKLHLYESKLSIDYQCTDVCEYAKQYPHTFDAVVCMELLEHVPHPQEIIQACAQMVKPNGFIFFSTINRNLKAYAFAVIGAEYIMNILPKGTHDYEKFIKPSELSAMARKADLSLSASNGMSYNPISKEYALSDNLDVNYLMSYRPDLS